MKPKKPQKLNKWLKSLPTDKRSAVMREIAAQCDVTAAAVRHWRAGIRRIPAEKCAAIVQATGGAITASDLRHDVFGVLTHSSPPDRTANATPS